MVLSSVEPRNADGSDEEVRRHPEKLGKLLGMHFTDGPLRVDDVGHIASGFENRKKVGLLQTPLFHQIYQHFVRTRIGQRMMLLFVVLDKTRHQVKGPIADLDHITWRGERLRLSFDTNALTVESVTVARKLLAKELRSAAQS